jgi:DnaJ-class molecular chaperone
VVDFQDYYAVLGVPKSAPEKEIRSAYRKLARQHHPDVNPRNPEAEATFKRINEAYEVLSDPDKRKKYDQLGSRWREYESYERAQAAAAAAGQPQQPFDFDDSVGDGPTGGGGARYEYRTVSPEDLEDLYGTDRPFSDFFETFFRPGGAAAASAGRAARPGRGFDLEYPIEVTLAEAYRGTTRTLELQQPDGSSRRLEVKIPPGVTEGSRVRIAGQGAPGRAGGPAGDLYLVTSVGSEPRFERVDDDLRTRVSAPLTTLLLGGEVHVPTPDGRRLALKIPAETQDGRVFRLRGQGMPHLGHPAQHGDLHAEVHVRLPERLSERERELLESFARARSDAEEESPVGGRP